MLPPVIGQVTKGSPAAAAGIQAGRPRHRASTAPPITDFQQLPQIISVSGGADPGHRHHRGGQRPDHHAVTPQLMRHPRHSGRHEPADGDRGAARSATAPVTHQHYGPVGAFGAACAETWNIIKTTILGIGQMIAAMPAPTSSAGPLGIAKMTRQVAEFGFLPLLNLVAVLSVSIGLANLFPIPLLDGGHLLYYGCEAVLGRPLGERAQDVGFRLGLVLVLGLMLLTTWNDLVRLNLF